MLCWMFPETASLNVGLTNMVHASELSCSGARTPEEILMKPGAFSRIGGITKKSNFVFIFF